MRTATHENFQNGKKLKLFRLQNKITIKEIAEFCKRSERTIHYWENGQCSMPKDIIDKLNKKYNLSLVWTTKGGTKVSQTQWVPKKVNISPSIKNDKELKERFKGVQKGLNNLQEQIDFILRVWDDLADCR